MEFAAILQIVLSILSFFTTVFITWFGITLKKKEKRREREEQLRQEEERLRKEEAEAICEGMQAILRDRIIQMYSHCEATQRVPLYAMENMSHMYHAYHTLGGNGAISALFEKFKKLYHPVSEAPFSQQ